MIKDEGRIEAVLAKAPLRCIEAYVTRLIADAYRGTALETFGAVRNGGRYNPPGIPALYTSFLRATALREAMQFLGDLDPVRPMSMLSIKVDTDRILDLTRWVTLFELRTSRRELTRLIVDKYAGDALPQILGRIAHDLGRFGGMIVWSRVHHKKWNLVLFPNRLGMEYHFYDPARNIPTTHPAIAETLRALMDPPYSR